MSFLNTFYQNYIVNPVVWSWPSTGWVAGFFAVIAAAGLTLWMGRRWRQYSSKGWQSYPVADNDTLLLIAVRHAVSVEHLARVNKLKKPYAIAAGKTILVPPEKPEKNESRADRPAVEVAQQSVPQTALLAQPGWRLVLWLPAIIAGWFVVAGISALWLVQTAPRPLEYVQIPIEPPATSTAIVLPSPLATPTPAVEVSIAKDAITITVLNGSGVAGVAKRFVDVFQQAGYRKLTVGNAEVFDYLGVTIQYRTGLKGAAEDLAKLLRNQFQQFKLEETAGTAVQDVTVIIGKEKP